MSRKRMAKCLALCALALAVCVGIAAALVISKNRQRAAEAAAAASAAAASEAAAKAATEYYTAANGKKYPLIAFTFTYTATEASCKQQKGTFTDYYYFDA